MRKQDHVLEAMPKRYESAFYQRLYMQRFSLSEAFLPKDLLGVKSDIPKHQNGQRVRHTKNNIQDKGEKALKGLKDLSRRVKEMVFKKAPLTYREVALNLISQTLPYLQSLSIHDRNKQQQNIKRRVYDALNVLIASKVLSKQGKRVSPNPTKKTKKIDELRKRIKKIFTKVNKKLQQKHQIHKLKKQIKLSRKPVLQAEAVQEQRVQLPVKGFGISGKFQIKRVGNKIQIYCSEKPSALDDIDLLKKAFLS